MSRSVGVERRGKDFRAITLDAQMRETVAPRECSDRRADRERSAAERPGRLECQTSRIYGRWPSALATPKLSR